jgi:hypothetical protein
MDVNDALNAVKKYAPILGSLIPGPGTIVGAGVSGVISLVQSALGMETEEEVNIQNVASIIQQNPELGLKLKQLELDHKVQLQNILLEHDRLELQNTDSARTMQISALEQRDKFSKRFVYIYAGFTTLSSFIYIACITFMTIPKDNIRIVDTIIGFLLGTLISTIVNFFFGSSSSSQAKDSPFKDLAETAFTNRK